MSGIYLHIPFCKQACHYCNFHFSTKLSYKGELVSAMQKEIILRHKELIDAVETIYFGGGTPSLLTSDELALLLETLKDHFDIRADAEITLEGNPDDLTPEKLQSLKSAGINRLSIGIQTFDDSRLELCNRAHATSESIRCLESAAAAGFDNISADLMYALPGTDLDHWASDLDQLLTFSPQHISLYGLTVEDKTVFGKWKENGKLQEVAEPNAADQYRHAIERLTGAGYEHYEVSNFSLPNYNSRHNTAYWQGKPYLGIGPGAHSFNGKQRGETVSNNQKYMQALKEESLPIAWEILSPLDQLNEYLFTGLRTRTGIDLEKIKNSFGRDLEHEHLHFLKDLENRKLIVKSGATIRLTSEGFMIADEITWRLFYDS